MSWLLDSLADVKVDASTVVGRLLLKAGVPDSPCVRRVAALPRKDKAPLSRELIERVSACLRAPGSSATLFPVQAEALLAFCASRGLLAPISVGEGKTLITWLGRKAMGLTGPALLLVPGGLVKKTQRDFDRYERDWPVDVRPTVLGYEYVSRNPDAIRKVGPVLVEADEVHYLKNLRATRTQRVAAWMTENPETLFMGLSGTIVDRSLMDFWHLALWALRHKAPVPLEKREAEMWARAVDLEVEVPLELGALTCLGDFGTRVSDTPGVVCGPPSEVHASIRIIPDVVPLPDVVRLSLDELDRTRARPDGIDLTDDMVVAHRFTKCLGFWLRWHEQPPEEWVRARRRWVLLTQAIRDANLPGLDSDLLVAARYGDSTPEGKDWFAVKDSFKPRQVVEWIDRGIIPNLVERARKHGDSLIWVGHRAVRELLPCDYYGEKGLTKDGRFVEDARGTVALSIKANKAGVNLQHSYAINYMLHMPGRGLDLEQLLGRTHRTGQKADEVVLRYYAPLKCYHERLKQAKRDAVFQQGFDKKQKKLLIADYE